MRILGWILGLPVLIIYHVLGNISVSLLIHILFSRDPNFVAKVYEIVCGMRNAMIPVFEIVCNKLKGDIENE